MQLPADLTTAENAAGELLVARAEDGPRALWWFSEDRDAALRAPDLVTSVSAVPGGYRVEVTARSLVKDLVLLADKVSPDAEVDDQLVTLLPGESTAFTVTTTAQVEPAKLTAPSVLRSANQLVQ